MRELRNSQDIALTVLDQINGRRKANPKYGYRRFGGKCERCGQVMVRRSRKRPVRVFYRCSSCPHSRRAGVGDRIR